MPMMTPLRGGVIRVLVGVVIGKAGGGGLRRFSRIKRCGGKVKRTCVI
jgi:hypothetical protein